MKQIFKQDIPFTQIANRVIEDCNLSSSAKGVYCYLFSRPNDWDFSSVRISENFKNGIDSIKSSLQELEKNNYLIRKKLQSGKVYYIIGYDLDIDEIRKVLDEEGLKLHLSGLFPQRAFPSKGFSLKGKIHHISNKESINNTEKKIILTNKTKGKEKILEMPKQIFEFFNLTCETNLKFTTDKQRQIIARLKVYSEQEIMQAISKRKGMPFYNGDNDQGKLWFKDWDSLFRNDNKIENILATEFVEPKPRHNPKARKLVY